MSPLVHIYMLFPGQEVRIGKDCAQGLEYVQTRSSKPVLFTEVFKRRDSVFADFRIEQ